MLQRLAEQMGRAIDATSTYICDWNAATGHAAVLAEYFSPHARPEELASDLGQTYSLEQDLGLTAEWLSSLQPLVAQVDDPALPDLKLQHMRQYGAKSTLMVPLTAHGNLFGYAELWESRRRRDRALSRPSQCGPACWRPSSNGSRRCGRRLRLPQW